MNRTLLIIFVATLFELLIGIIATEHKEKLVNYEESISNSKLVASDNLSKDGNQRVHVRLKRKVYSWYVDTNLLSKNRRKEEEEEEPIEVPVVAVANAPNANSSKTPVIAPPASSGDISKTPAINQPGIVFSHSGDVNVQSSCLKNGKKVNCPSIENVKQKSKEIKDDYSEETSDETSKSSGTAPPMSTLKWNMKQPKKSKIPSMVILPFGVHVSYPKIHHISSPLMSLLSRTHSNSLNKEAATEPYEPKEKVKEVKTIEAPKKSNAYISSGSNVPATEFPVMRPPSEIQPHIVRNHKTENDYENDVKTTNLGDNSNSGVIPGIPTTPDQSTGDFSTATSEAESMHAQSEEESSKSQVLDDDSSKNNVEESHEQILPITKEELQVSPGYESSVLKPVFETTEMSHATEFPIIRSFPGDSENLKPKESENSRIMGEALNTSVSPKSPDNIKPGLESSSVSRAGESTKLSSEFTNNRIPGEVINIRPSVDSPKIKPTLELPKFHAGIESQSTRPVEDLRSKISPVLETTSGHSGVVESSKNDPAVKSSKVRPVDQPEKGRPVIESSKGYPTKVEPTYNVIRPMGVPNSAIKNEKKANECLSSSGKKIECNPQQNKHPPKYDVVYAITSSEESEEVVSTGDSVLPGGIKDQMKSPVKNGNIEDQVRKHISKAKHKFSDIKKLVKKIKFTGIKNMVIKDLKKGMKKKVKFNSKQNNNGLPKGDTKLSIIGGINQQFSNLNSKLPSLTQKALKPDSNSLESTESEEVIVRSSKEQITYTRDGKIVRKKINCRDEKNRPIDCDRPNKPSKNLDLTGFLTRRIRAVLPSNFHKHIANVKKQKLPTDYDTIKLNSKETFRFSKDGKSKKTFCYNDQNERVSCAPQSKKSKKKSVKHLSRGIRGVLPSNFYKEMANIRKKPKPSNSVETVRLNSRETFSYTIESVADSTDSREKDLLCYNDKNEKVDCASKRKKPKKKGSKHSSRRPRSVLPPSFYQAMQRMKNPPNSFPSSVETVLLNSREELSPINTIHTIKNEEKDIHCYNEQNEEVDCLVKTETKKEENSDNLNQNSRGVLPKHFFKKMKKIQKPMKPSADEEVIRISSTEEFSYTKAANVQLTCYDGMEKVDCGTLGKSAQTVTGVNSSDKRISIKDSYQPSSHKSIEQIYPTPENEDIKQPVKSVRYKDDKGIICVDQTGNQSIDCVPSKHSIHHAKGNALRKHKLNSAEFLTSMEKIPHSKHYPKSKISHHTHKGSHKSARKLRRHDKDRN